MGAPDLLYAEDIAVGTAMCLGECELGEGEIVAFAEQWDPLPIHTDPEFAATGPFGGIIASGVHTIAVLGRFIATGFASRLAIVAGRHLSVELIAPVRPGIRQTCTLTVADMDLSPEGTAWITWDVRLLDPDDRATVQMVGRTKILKRPE